MMRQKTLVEHALDLRAGRVTPDKLPPGTMKKITGLSLVMGGEAMKGPSQKKTQNSRQPNKVRRVHA